MPIYECKTCSFITSANSQYLKHIATKKHNKLNETKTESDKEDIVKTMLTKLEEKEKEIRITHMNNDTEDQINYIFDFIKTRFQNIND